MMKNTLTTFKIAFLAEDYPPNQGGIAEYSINLLHALTEQGRDVHVVSAHVTGDSDEDNTSPAPITRIGQKDVRRKKLGLLSRHRANQAFQNGLDLWFQDNYHDGPPDFAIVCSVSAWANSCRRLKIPYVICVHGGDAFGKRTDFLRSIYHRLSVQKILHGATVICANSEYTAHQLRKSISGISDKIITTYCGISNAFKKEVDSRVVTKAGEDTPGTNLLMMCRLVPIKACDVVIRSIEKLQKKYPNITLKIAGDGPLRDELESLSKKLGLEDSVHFIGYVDDLTRKADLFMQSDLYVQSGRIDPHEGRPEAFGIVFAEAGACNLPVIGPRLGGVPEVILDEETGYLVEPDSIESLVKAIDKILSNSEKAKTMGAAGKRHVNDKFDYSNISDKIISRMS